MGSIFLTRDLKAPPALGVWNLNYWKSQVSIKKKKKFPKQLQWLSLDTFVIYVGRIFRSEDCAMWSWIPLTISTRFLHFFLNRLYPMRWKSNGFNSSPPANLRYLTWSVGLSITKEVLESELLVSHSVFLPDCKYLAQWLCFTSLLKDPSRASSVPRGATRCQCRSWLVPTPGCC